MQKIIQNLLRQFVLQRDNNYPAKQHILSLTVLIVTFIFATSSFSQTTDCSTATLLTAVNASSCTPGTTFNISGTGTGPVMSSCNTGGAAANNWGRFVANGTTATISYAPDPGRDAMIYAYSGTCPSGLIELGCIDNFGNGAQEDLVLTSLIPGAIYYFRIVRYNSTNSMNGAICITSLNSIRTGTVTGSPFCAGNTVSIPFTTYGTYSGNTYSAQMSNAAGSFASPVSIGTLVSNLNSGTISATIPLGSGTGSGYRIRVISSGPAVTGSDNGTNLTIVVATVTLSSAAGTSAQTVCNNTAITNITYSVGGTATGANVSGLPTGVTGSFSSGVFTISGTPIANGTFNYTVTTTGGSCTAATAAGTITVNGLATITRTSAAATTAQTVCNGTAITNISYSVGGTATGAGVSGLPTGVSGSFSAGVFTISGTPTTNGTFNYTVTTSGGSCPVTATGSITVNGLPTLTLTSTAGTNTQTLCNSNSITNITYSVSGSATGAGVIGLPTGLNGNFSAGVFAISGTPTANGTFNFTVTTTGGSCTAATAAGTITVNGLATITRTSGGATTAQTVCNGTVITNITYSVGGTATGAGVSGLPTGVTGSFSAGVFTITGTPTLNGTFNYTLTTSGGSCSVTATGTIIVNSATIALSSTAGTNTQTVCNGTAITNITYSVGGTATGAGVSGLPAGVTGSFGAGVFTISGTTTANGTFNYTVTTTGGSCTATTATGTIIVNGLATITRTSAAATNAQTVCNGITITNITYSISGTATGAGVSGLPTGVTGSFSAGVFTISSTPIANGTFNYTGTTTGGNCPVTATGTIIVNAATIALSSAVGTNTQTICNSTAISNITYSVGGTATGAGVSGLPAGVTGAFSSGVFTISGTSTAGGTFNYTVTTTGGSCAAVVATGTITINTSPTVTISANYCMGGGVVRLICSAQTSYLWSTGATSQFIDVITAGSYSVTGTNAAGCSVSANISVALELVTNGNFSSGNTGFTTLYNYNANLFPEGNYYVGTNANTYHSGFYCNQDHTTGSGNFMIVNGSPVTQQVWQQTVTVLPNTTYYFSAWATSMNTVAPYAQLQFSVNSVQVGTVATLPAGASSPAGPFIWYQFYGTWNSGSNTTAVINVIDLQTALGGNDFGLDDISFSTLSPVSMSVAPGTNSPVCAGNALNMSANLTGGQSPFTYSWTGPSSYTSSSQNPVIPSTTAANAGIYSLTVTNGNGCSASGATSSVIVNGVPTNTLTSPAGTNTQSLCNGTAITNVTYSIGGTGTGAGTSGLPTGVTGSFSAGVFTISGTPTVNGTFYYTVTTTGGSCTAATATGSITVNGLATITRTSAAATTAQAGCNGIPITNITYSVGGTGTGAGVGGLPTGITGSFSAGVFTISGTPTTNGTFNYTVTTTGGTCAAIATGTITVNGLATITRTSAAATSAQTMCTGTAITNITYSVGGTGTGAGVSGLPTGVTGSFSAGTFTISGTPTANGTFNYTVTTTGGSCTAASATGTININGLATITSISPAATTAQTVCNGTSITNISYLIGGTGTGAGVSGLPTGVTGAFFAGVFTISGTPTANGTFNYTVTTTGGSCPATASGTITVNAATASLSSAGGTNAQTVCNNTAITNITYSVGGTGTGAGVSGLPTGVTGSFSANVFTISGTPTANGTFNYTVTTTGGSCTAATTTGTITVNGLATISRTSALATTTQTVCNGTAITNITYSVGGTATGGGVSGLPTGVTGSFNAGVFTISGTPTANGTFNYTVTTTGGSCAVTATGNITVNGLTTITRTSTLATTAQTVCNGTAITNITYSIGGTGTGAVVSGLPTGVTGSFSVGVFTISGTPTANGTFNYTVTTTGGSCPVTGSGTITVNALPIDIAPTAAATNVCTGNSTNIQITASQSGVTYQLRNNAGNINIGSTVAGTGGTIILPTGSLSATTTFNVLASNFVSGCATQLVNTVTVTVSITGQWVGGATGDWNTAANWCGGVPTSSTNISIPAGSTVNIQSANAFANAVNIAATGSLVMTGAYNLSISSGGAFANSGTFNATSSTGTVAFFGSGTISGTTTFKNIDTYGALNFGAASTIAGTFSIQSGGSVSGNSPTYTCPSSSLLYKPGSVYTRGLEWTNASSGTGYPANVLVQNNTTINFPGVGNGYVCFDVQIEAGSSIQLNYLGGSASLSVGRNINISGTLALGGSMGGDVSLGGNWTRNTGGVFTHNDRKVTFDGPANFSGNGTAMATITGPASAAKNNEGGFGGENFAHLWINKTNTTDSVVLLSNITINQELGFTKGVFSLRNSDVTIVSNSTRTADIAPIASIANISIRYGGTGKFVVQRFIQNPTATRSWRLLTAPLQSAAAPSINEAFMEGVVNPDKSNPNGTGSIYNPWPGYGTHITGPGGLYSAANGFDQGTTSASILYGAPGVSSWLTPLSTLTTKITDQQGWMMFVRGDRSFVIGNQYMPSANAILEPKGRINVGNVTVPVMVGRQVIGNPYPSAICLLNVDVAGTLGKLSSYHLWDPKMFTSFTQPGKWVSFTGLGSSFVQTTSASSYLSNGTIESGQAFLLDAVAAGSITFHETDKLPLTSSLVGISNTNGARPTGNTLFPLFRSDIYAKTDTSYRLTDGVLNIFNSSFSNTATDEDAKKMISFNTKESLSILRDSVKIAIEKRSEIQNTDTIFFAMSKFNELPYRFRFEATDFAPGYEAFLEDKFTGYRLQLSTAGVSEIDFAITTNPLSKAEDRFRVVFKSPVQTVLPVTFASIKAWQQNKKIAVQWQVANEINIKAYEVEKSVDGITFTKVNTTLSSASFAGNYLYNWLDETAVAGDNYYRIKSNGINEKFSYSEVVKVRITNGGGSIKVYPNPVADRIMRLHFKNMDKGKYSIRLLNATGQTMVNTSFLNAGSVYIKEIQLAKGIAKGLYQFEITHPGSEKSFVKVIIE